MFGIIIGWVYFYLTNDSALKPTFTTIVSNFIGMGCYYWSSPLWFLLTLSLVKIITPHIEICKYLHTFDWLYRYGVFTLLFHEWTLQLVG